ncbi:flagellar hook-basal body complex protein [Gracilibacillus oryzae]|uniref:Flagellar hook protein FlgE n=1 Tax=Gracilibacillus oryzae TaxID=1672701 RepID=A0A7C8GUZ9_9BACI|nr:flagellar basal body rod protein FlgG [Gracilibacillus oryzae]KAB8138743.1 flagellar hook-basal body complex protein [Gracilibacillus oryzae]
MLRSMYAGISGMKSFQTKLDVVGNNIANVNTIGFKKGRTTFQDMMSQPVNGASAPTNIRGGINPSQVGTGVQLGTIDNIHTQGNRQTTNRPLDLQLEGDGMFVFGSGFDALDTAAETPTVTTFTTAGIQENPDVSLAYSRAGNLYLDDEGFIVNANGQYLMGFQPTENNDGIDGENAGPISIPAGAESFSIQGDGVVNYIEGGVTKIAGQITLSKFSNPGGLQKIGSNMFQTSPNDGQIYSDLDNNNQYTAEADSILFAPESAGTASIVAGALEMSNVDLSEEFTEMITAQRGFQANTRIITTSDEILQELVNLKR